MNYIKHLTGFFNRIALEENITPTHISLYISIFQYWNLNRFQNPIQISRDEIMRTSKIGSNATYHKYIRDLESLGFIEYSPSFNPFAGTAITMIDLCNTKSKIITSVKRIKPTSSPNKLVRSVACLENEQLAEQPYIYNNKTSKNSKNIYKGISKNESDEFDTSSITRQVDSNNKEPIQQEKVKIPSLKKVKGYFEFQKSSEFEAERFFNYYSSNGWLIGGKTKMEDWKASARNWMLNTNKFVVNMPKQVQQQSISRAQNLHTETNKNYSEPL